MGKVITVGNSYRVGLTPRGIDRLTCMAEVARAGYTALTHIPKPTMYFLHNGKLYNHVAGCAGPARFGWTECTERYPSFGSETSQSRHRSADNQLEHEVRQELLVTQYWGNSQLLPPSKLINHYPTFIFITTPPLLSVISPHLILNSSTTILGFWGSRGIGCE